MTTKQRSTSVSPYEIEQWDGPKTVVVKNPEGKIAYEVFGNEDDLKHGYYAAQENPRGWWNAHYAEGVETVFYNISQSEQVSSGMSREDVEEILRNVKHTHSWKKDDTCRCGLSKE